MHTLVKLKHLSVISTGAYGGLMVRNDDDEWLPIAVTLERTYGIGLAQASKITPGIHKCTRTMYNKGGYETFEIHVDGHTRILFHILNIEDQSEGCVGIGESFDPVLGQPGIIQSKKAFNQFMSYLTGVDEFYLLMEG